MQGPGGRLLAAAVESTTLCKDIRGSLPAGGSLLAPALGGRAAHCADGREGCCQCSLAELARRNFQLHPYLERCCASAGRLGVERCWTPDPLTRFHTRCYHVGKAAVGWCADLAAQIWKKLLVTVNLAVCRRASLLKSTAAGPHLKSAFSGSGLVSKRLPACRGHASEVPDLPLALSKTASGIRFLGPSAAAMSALGDKVSPSEASTSTRCSLAAYTCPSTALFALAAASCVDGQACSPLPQRPVWAALSTAAVH